MRHSIILAADQQYIPHMATAIRSLVENNRDLSFNVHVINCDIDARQWERLVRTVDGFDCQLIDAKVDTRRLDSLVTNDHFTPANYYRLFAAEMVAAPSALYLDADLVVTTSIADLLTAADDGNAVAAVADPGAVPHPDLGMSPDAGYFNSGVMRLNLDRWRALDLAERVIELVRDRPAVIRFVDQCGLNAVIDGAWTRLDPEFNVQTVFWTLDEEMSRRTYGPAGVAGAMAAPRILHFSGGSKPWHLNDRHPLRPLYWQYRQRTAFSRLIPDDVGVRTLARRLLPSPVVRGLHGLTNRVK